MRLLLLLAALAAACAKPPASAPVSFSPADGSFEALAPGHWRVDQEAGLTRKAAFFGPPDGPRAFSEMIRVALHPAQDPEAFRAARAPGGPPLTETSAGGAKAWQFVREDAVPDPHAPTRRMVTRTVLIPSPRGLFALEHSWPAESRPGPAFDEFLASFRAKP